MLQKLKEETKEDKRIAIHHKKIMLRKMTEVIIKGKNSMMNKHLHHQQTTEKETPKDILSWTVQRVARRYSAPSKP